MAEAPKAKKKGFKLPDVIAFLFLMVLIVTIFTWIIPAGQYDRTQVMVGASKQIRVVPDTYHTVAANPQAPWAVVPALVKGFTQSASMIFMVFFCGAAVFVLEKTGTVRVFFQRIIARMEGRELWAVFAVMFLMSMGGATGALANTTLALLPLGILLSRGLGYDGVVGLGMIYLGAYAGFNVGWGNVFTIGIAQDIAELPKLSGFNARVVFHVVNLMISFWLVAAYAKRIKADPYKSYNYEEGMKVEEFIGPQDDTGVVEEMKLKHYVCGLITVLGFAAIIVGSLQWGWGVPEYSSTFVAMAILCGLCGGLGVDGTAQNFIKGCASITAGAFVIGIARAISVVMSDGKIIDSIVYYLAQVISSFGPVVGASVMFYANCVINFFVPSGSGQAVAVMPLMVPIADLSGISRQVAVQAFQFGDGLSNCIIPTSGVLMSSLAIAKMSYGNYVKWFGPLMILQIILASAALTILQIIGWN